MVIEMQKTEGRVPPQVDRQQPVYSEDAHGRVAPFHVEFIDSFEVHYQPISVSALETLLKARTGFSSCDGNPIPPRTRT